MEEVEFPGAPRPLRVGVNAPQEVDIALRVGGKEVMGALKLYLDFVNLPVPAAPPR